MYEEKAPAVIERQAAVTRVADTETQQETQKADGGSVGTMRQCERRENKG